MSGVLVFADLKSADLKSADLKSADLTSADLKSADLTSADEMSTGSNVLDSCRMPYFCIMVILDPKKD
jgi:uncharacterized protein YjbI with pentapeptide repeats